MEITVFELGRRGDHGCVLEELRCALADNQPLALGDKEVEGPCVGSGCCSEVRHVLARPGMIPFDTERREEKQKGRGQKRREQSRREEKALCSASLPSKFQLDPVLQPRASGGEPSVRARLRQRVESSCPLRGDPFVWFGCASGAPRDTVRGAPHGVCP